MDSSPGASHADLADPAMSCCMAGFFLPVHLGSLLIEFVIPCYVRTLLLNHAHLLLRLTTLPLAILHKRWIWLFHDFMDFLEFSQERWALLPSSGSL